LYKIKPALYTNSAPGKGNKMPETFVETITLTRMECGECGIVFAMPTSKYNRCYQNGEGWHCPNGHGRIFTESETTRLQKQLTAERERTIREKAAREQAQAEATELRDKNIRITGKLSCLQTCTQWGLPLL
jgi:uncharacterized OB-fold protein